MLLLVSGATRAVNRHKDSPYLGQLLTPNNGNSADSIMNTGLKWGADNAAFSGFDEVKFRHMLKKITGAHRCLWVCSPDVVGDARATLELFDIWQPIIAPLHAVAMVAQDGIEETVIPWDKFQCLFIGGSTEFKLCDSTRLLVAEAKNRGKLVHMGRVNSKRRIRLAFEWGCDSVDGTAASRWSNIYIPLFLEFIAELVAEREAKCHANTASELVAQLSVKIDSLSSSRGSELAV